MKHIIFLFAMLAGGIANANEIYIAQIGDTLDLDITQDGEDNQFGISTQDAVLDGDDMTFDITQTGDFNSIAAVIKGNTYTGTWTFTGNNNNVDLVCDATTGVNCENVTLNIATVGDSNEFELEVGKTADADGAQIDFEIDGDGNVIASTVNGTSAVLNITVDNSATSSTATVSDSIGDYTAGSGGNVIVTNQSGDGDSGGHSITLDITGGGSVYEIDQSGVNDNLVDGTFSGDGQNVKITQSD